MLYFVVQKGRNGEKRGMIFLRVGGIKESSSCPENFELRKNAALSAKLNTIRKSGTIIFLKNDNFGKNDRLK